MGQLTYSCFMRLSIFGLTPLSLSLPSASIIPDMRSSSLTESGILRRLGDMWTSTSYLYWSSPSAGRGGSPGMPGDVYTSWPPSSMLAGRIDAAAAAAAACARWAVSYEGAPTTTLTPLPASCTCSPPLPLLTPSSTPRPTTRPI